MHAPFHVVKQKNTTGKTYYQVRFFDENGKIVKRKSYPPGTSRTRVCLLAREALARGIIPSSLDPVALSYCEEFWSADSPYFKSQALRGKPLSASYRNAGFYGLKHFKPYLDGKLMSQLTPEGLEAFAETLALKGINPRSINLGLAAIKRPYALYCKKLRIPNNLSSVEPHVEKPKERGTLTEDELGQIILSQADSRCRLVVFLGAMCGLRKGEVRGLKHEDIDYEKRLMTIRHNLVLKEEGMKDPKCKSFRTVPLPKQVLYLIGEVKETYEAFFKRPCQYVVPNRAGPDKPCDGITVKRGFQEVLKAIGITEELRKERNLVYHSAGRHTFITLLQKKGIPPFMVAGLSGHRSLAMVDNYTHFEKGHMDFGTARAAIEQAGKYEVTKDYITSV